MNQQLEQFKALKVGGQYTFVKFGEFGFPYHKKITLLEIRVQPYAQYPETVALVFKEKGKRKASGVRFYGQDYEQYLIYEGHHDVNTEAFVKTIEGPFSVAKQSLASFDGEYLTRAKASVNGQPVIEKLSCS